MWPHGGIGRHKGLEEKVVKSNLSALVERLWVEPLKVGGGFKMLIPSQA